MFPWCIDDMDKEWGYDDLPDLSDKVALVTGANVGLGLYTAKHLALKGATVIMGCRSMDKCNNAATQIKNESDNEALKLIPMKVDLSSLQSVQDFAANVIEFTDTLDILVFNAGLAFTDKWYFSTEGVELTFAVNHLGHFKLYKDLEKLILSTAEKAEAAGTEGGAAVSIVHVSSAASFFPVPENSKRLFTEAFINSEDNSDPYALSKLANVLFSNELARRLPKNVVSNSLHPGFVDTNIFWRLHYFFRNKIPVVGAAMSSMFQSMQDNVMWSSEEGALTQVYAAASTEVMSKGLTGKYLHPIGQIVEPAPAATEENQILLWELSEKILKSKGF